MNVRVTSTLRYLEDDLRDVAKRASRDIRATVADGIREGNRAARSYAKKSAGAHGKHYPNAFTTEMHPAAGLGSASGEYGPDASMPQGGMSFERGSRNQPPHLDLARSADLIAPVFAKKVRALPDRWFW